MHRDGSQYVQIDGLALPGSILLPKSFRCRSTSGTHPPSGRCSGFCFRDPLESEIASTRFALALCHRTSLKVAADQSRSLPVRGGATLRLRVLNVDDQGARLTQIRTGGKLNKRSGMLLT